MATRRWLQQNVSFGNIVNLGAILLAAAGFYFSTNFKLDDHDARLSALRLEMTKQETSLRGLEVAERTARDEVRKELSGKMERVADGVSLLNVKAATQEAQLTALTKELTRVGNQLESAIRMGATRLR